MTKPYLAGPRNLGGFTNLLDALFSPFYGLDFSVFYDRYHPIIDFLVFVAFFIPVARLTLEKRFPGRAGKALAVAVGTILALSLVVAEASLGFSLRSFGPVAAGILIGTVGLVLFLLIKHAGAGTATAGSFAIILVYFILRAVLPDFFLWSSGNPWSGFLHSIFVIAVLVALFRVSAALFHSREAYTSIGKLSDKVQSVAGNNRFEAEVTTNKKELGLLKHRLSKFTRKATKDSKEIVGEVRDIMTIVGENGADQRALAAIGEKLKVIAPKEHRIERELKRIVRTDLKLKAFDVSEIADLRKGYRALPDDQKKACRMQFLEAREKLGVEKRVHELTQAVHEYQKQFAYLLGMAVHSLTAARQDDTLQWLGKAIQEEERAEHVLEGILGLEKKLVALAKKQIQQAQAQN